MDLPVRATRSAAATQPVVRSGFAKLDDVLDDAGRRRVRALRRHERS